MKMALTSFLLFLSFATVAQEVVQLNSSSVQVNSASATIIRTNQTPETVEITFLVPMANTYCEQYNTRLVYRTSGYQCGNSTQYRRTGAGQVCIRRNPYNNQCLASRPVWREERVQIPRTCEVPETYCAKYGAATSFETDSMKIQFKNLPVLGDSESETFTISALQRGMDSEKVNYDIRPLKTLGNYAVSQKKILFIKRDVYVIEEK